MTEHTHWTVLKSRLIHDAMPWVRLSSEHVLLPNGVEIEDFYRVEITPYVTMFALTTDNKVAMVEHYKHGPQAVSLELPAGYIEPDDTPLQAAQRELLEETGLHSRAWQALGRQFIDGNRGCGWVHAFLARDCQRIAKTEHEATEIMSIHYKSLDEIYTLWRSQQIINVAAISIIGRSLLELGYLSKT